MKKAYLILCVTFTTLALSYTSKSGDRFHSQKNKARPHVAMANEHPKVERKMEASLTTVVAQPDTVPTATAGSQLAYTSKYDFVPGDKIIAYEDFSSVNLGDFPLKWNTDGSAEVVTVDNMQGKWLKIGKKGVFHPEAITSLPENFTLEFDLAVNNANYLSPLCLNFANLKKPEDFVEYAYLVSLLPEHAVHLEFKAADAVYDGVSKLITGKSGVATLNNTIEYKVWDVSKNNVAHIGVWRQAQRLRVYLNGEKIWDTPRAFEAPSHYNAVTFAFYGPYGEEDYYLLSNIRLAVGAPDTRNKLLTEGKFVTSGIHFDVDSDQIKPDSYGILKEVATVLKENEAVNIKIVGHTDSDGDDAHNMALSKRRAESVKQALAAAFQISPSRMETDGKGESAPVSKNDSPVGKAQNRRVEFVKL